MAKVRTRSNETQAQPLLLQQREQDCAGSSGSAHGAGAAGRVYVEHVAQNAHKAANLLRARTIRRRRLKPAPSSRKKLGTNGDSRNTTISLQKIVDGHVFSDCVKVEKSTGKPDLFTMNAAQARFVLSLVGVLKEQ